MKISQSLEKMAEMGQIRRKNAGNGTFQGEMVETAEVETGQNRRKMLEKGYSTEK